MVRALLFDVLAVAKGELTPEERLFVTESTKHEWEVHKRWLAELYIECGCIVEALPILEACGAVRKMGDLAWAMGNPGSAKGYYESVSREHKRDWDRLFRMAFLAEDWNEVIQLFLVMDAFPVPLPGQFVLGSTAVPTKPVLEMVAVALAKLCRAPDNEVLERFSSCVGIDRNTVQKACTAAAAYSDQDIVALKKRLTPRIVRRTTQALTSVLEKGDTTRARQLMAYVLDADSIVATAKKHFVDFLAQGDDQSLAEFLQLVTASGLHSITENVRFAAMSLPWGKTLADYPDHVVLRLLGSHPCMNRKHFGQLLDLKFRNHMLPSGQDLVTGFFQQLAVSIPGTEVSVFDFAKLRSAEEWAVAKCEDWLSGEGHQAAEAVMQSWIRGTCRQEKTLFTMKDSFPKEPRDTTEWHKLLEECLSWLAREWERELENTTWKSETELFFLIKRSFRDCEVFRHASPSWLAPQHFDIYIPDLDLAVEYMGEQHFRAVAFFGGEDGWRQTVQRDEKKRKLAAAWGIRLEEVRFDEEMKNAVARIRSER